MQSYDSIDSVIPLALYSGMGVSPMLFLNEMHERDAHATILQP